MTEESLSIAPPWEAKEIIGHEPVINEFVHAFEKGRLAHAWLITGQKGIGKATLAYRFAYLLLKQGRSTAEKLFAEEISALPMPDPLDPLYRQITTRSHPDLRVIELGVNERTGRLQKDISVEDIRQLGDFMHLTASVSPWRVVIIDSIDDLNKNAANALLKSLEEPREGIALFLISHTPGRLLPTIRSRCRRLALSPLSVDQILKALGNNGLQGSERDLILDLADGSLGTAMELASTENMETIKAVIALLMQWPDFPPKELHRLGDFFAERGQNQRFTTVHQVLAWWWRRYARFAISASLPEIFPGEADLAARWCNGTDIDQWLSLWEKINRLFELVDNANADRKQIWLNCMLEIAGMAGAGKGIYGR